MTTTTTTTTDLDTRLRALLDRDEVETLLHRVGSCLDEGTFDVLRGLLTDDVSARTPGGQAEGVDAVIAQASRNHDPAVAIQHLITDVIVELDGDEAMVGANLVVTFADRVGDPTPTRRQGSRYDLSARRTPQGWRFTRIASSPVWRIGDLTPVTAAP